MYLYLGDKFEVTYVVQQYHFLMFILVKIIYELWPKHGISIKIIKSIAGRFLTSYSSFKAN